MKLRRICSVVMLGLAAALAMPGRSQAQVICNGNASPPPELPVYDQPPMPAPGYIWTPGYWGGGPLGYFWVPGTWVEPPAVGLLWTPGYWGWRDGIYLWNAGYWGPRIGFYGGVNYGFGYGGVGYQGGRWVNGVFSYNQTVNNFASVHITNVYNETVANNNVTRVSFNGGSGGITARPTAQEEAAAQERHVAAIPAQVQQERTASTNKELLASENHGRPAIAATAKPGEFTGKGVMAAREAAPPTGTKSIEKEESHKPLKEEAEPKPKGPEAKPSHEEAKLPGDKSEPRNTHAKPTSAEPRTPQGEAKVPGEKPLPLNTRAKPLEQAPKATHEPPHVAAGSSGRPNPKPPAKDKKSE